MPQNLNQTSLFLSEFTPTPYLQREISTEHPPNMETLEVSEVRVSIVNERSVSADDLSSNGVSRCPDISILSKLVGIRYSYLCLDNHVSTLGARMSRISCHY